MKIVTGFYALIFLGNAAAAQDLSVAEKALFVAFAEAVSGSDPDMLDVAERLDDTPPATLETIDFYGMENAPPASRALRGIMSALDNEGHLVSFEPSFVLLEFEGVMQAAGAFSPDRPLPDMLSHLPEGEWDTQLRKTVGAIAMNSAIAEFAIAAQAEMDQQDRVILDVTLPAGDVVFYWVTTPPIAADWHCALLLAKDALYGPTRVEETIVRRLDWNAFREMTLRSVNIDPDLFPSPVDLPVQPCLLS